MGLKFRIELKKFVEVINALIVIAAYLVRWKNSCFHKNLLQF